MKQKLAYLWTCLRHCLNQSRYACPSCGAQQNHLIQRKYLVTSLRRCTSCRLLFRTPTTTAGENEAFYQEDYSQGYTSDVPDDATLQHLIDTGFAGSERDYTTFINILEAVGAKPGALLLDFGCSWGYGSWQLQKRGFNVKAFEISKPRCRYAHEKLQVEAYDDLKVIKEHAGQFDVFFSSHVLEHLPSVSEALDLAKTLLKPGGLFVAVTPNGSRPYKEAHPKAWNGHWGGVHPNFLDDEYYIRHLPNPLLASIPYDIAAIQAAFPADGIKIIRQLDGFELVVACRF